MNMIVAVDNNFAIGYQGRLLVQIPLDQQLFREMTKNKVIVYGRKTLATFPNEIPLAGRTNIILSEDKDYSVRGAVCVHSMEEALEYLKGYKTEDIFIVGGESIYKQFLPYCDTIHLTKIDYEYKADRYFPDITKSPEWQMTAESDEQTYFDVEYYFQKYERKNF
ncbi:MAG: dihydrofolate reductase [Lachnospiraceae bacterium]|nr:dihydrofolate reductase [Lachnospiraceae bacterium]